MKLLNVASLTGFHMTPNSLSPDGRFLITGGPFTTKVWAWPKLEFVNEVADIGYDLKFIPGTDLCCTRGYKSDKIFLWTFPKFQKYKEIVLKHWRYYKNEITSLAISPNQNWLAAGRIDDSISLIDLSHYDEKILRFDNRFPLEEEFFSPSWLDSAQAIYATEITSQGYLAAGSERKGAIWTFPGKVDYTLEARGDVTDIKFSPDGKSVAFASEYGLSVFPLNKSYPLASHFENGVMSSSISFSPNGRVIFVGTTHGTLEIVDSKTGYLVNRALKVDDSESSGAYVRLLMTGNGVHLIAGTNQYLKVWQAG